MKNKFIRFKENNDYYNTYFIGILNIINITKYNNIIIFTRMINKRKYSFRIIKEYNE